MAALGINQDTIAALATPPGNGGVAVIRISGTVVPEIIAQLIRKKLPARTAIYTSFLDADNVIIDSGIALYFPAPASFTGEHVLELHGHGGSVISNMLLKRVLALGARLAQPGEFSQRAFLNNKIDLVQAEAIADLIVSHSEQAVRSAQQSLQGVFSKQINTLVDELTELRIYIEAAIDFVDEEINFLTDGVVEQRLTRLLQQVTTIGQTAQQGRLLREGISLVLAGKPNTGKSSLLNALAGHDAAIVTDIPGTTRDVLRERIQIDGLPINIIDTAGLRESQDVVEQEGIRRARREINNADIVLFMQDVRSPEFAEIEVLPERIKRIHVFNKIDLVGVAPSVVEIETGAECFISVKTGAGVALLTEQIKKLVGFQSQASVFMARTRHLDALAQAQQHLEQALAQLKTHYAFELVAEELRIAQQHLGEITGQVSSDELLGKIFASFCIGK